MLKIPSKFNQKLIKSPLYPEVLKTFEVFSKLFEENKLYFFPEYTDHGVKHINSVLKAAEEIISEETIEKILSPNDIAILVLSILLHDLGMHLSFDSFKSLIEGKNDDIKIKTLDEKTWSQIWEEYLDEAKKFNGKQLYAIFGNESHIIRIPNLDEPLNISKGDILLIGEFIRRNHPRIAHEVALKGLIGNSSENILEFAKDAKEEFKKLAGIIARSHGMEIRDTFEYLKTISEIEWSQPYSINVVFLMVVLRIADYFQFDSLRVDEPLLKLRTFSSPVSKTEHDQHLAIKFVKPSKMDPETLYVEAAPIESNLFLKLNRLFNSIQYELDISWAILGEIYGTVSIDKQPKIKYRRIKSNLDKHGKFIKEVSYIPEKIAFDYDPDLSKLLIAPLYGENPIFGIRELLQNAIDACNERALVEERLSNDYEAKVKISLTKKENKDYFIIEDNGKGMTILELKSHFLKAGSSFRKSSDWQKVFSNNSGQSEVMRSGRFGVGVLAAFLLGDEIEVFTKNKNEEFTYNFKAKLDNEQLNIIKIKGGTTGTKIEICIDPEKVKIIENQKWGNWYKFKTPKVLYSKEENKWYTFKELIDPNSVTIKDNIISPKNFKKVIWSYANKDNPQTTCNGIIIPKYYSFITKSNIKPPTIHIIDYNAQLALNLSRNSIMGKVPFEEELLEDIYKDFIAYLLLFESNYLLEDNKLIYRDLKQQPKHPSGLDMSTFFYTNTGYLINNEFFFKDHFRKKHLFHIGHKGRIEANQVILDFSKSSLENHLISCEVFNNFVNQSNYFQKISEVGGYIQFYKPTILYHSKKWYDSIITEKGKVHHTIKKDCSIIETQHDWICWACKLKKDPILKLEDILPFLPKLTFIKERPLKLQFPKNDLKLNELLKKYFGENYIIPYTIEERKKSLS